MIIYIYIFSFYMLFDVLTVYFMCKGFPIRGSSINSMDKLFWMKRCFIQTKFDFVVE